MSNLETKETYGLFATPLNIKLISELNQKGADILIFQPIKTEKIELNEIVKNQLTNLAEFDWLIFTDVFSVEFFIESLRELEIDLFELDALTICAFGESVADRLRFVQVHADVIPAKVDCETVFAAISEYAADDLSELRFLVLKQEKLNLKIVEKLKAAQAIVDVLPIYQSNFDDESANIKLKTLLQNGAVDEFIFSSPEDLVSLKLLYNEIDLTNLLSEITVYSTSENTYQTLLENGLRPLYFHHK